MKMDNNTSNMITLKCFCCGKEEYIVGEGNIEIALDLINVVNQSSFKYTFDMNRGRTLLFCSEECRKKMINKNGTYKARCGYKSKNANDKMETWLNGL